MKAIILQHEDSTPPGSVIEWVESKNIDYEVYNFSQCNIYKNITYDILFILGGSMNVDEEDIYPWLINEKNFISRAIQEKKLIIGLCLGAQLLAEALGGKVFRAKFTEIGWQDVWLNEQRCNLKVFEWHSYQFELPEKAIKIAENKCCPVQGFRFSDFILAFQFHPETTVKWAIECANDPNLPQSSNFIQSKSEILNQLHCQTFMQNWFFTQLDNFIQNALSK